MGGTPDYYPIFGFQGAPGMSGGSLFMEVHNRLIQTGMPSHIGGFYINWQMQDLESWCRYWGTSVPLYPDFKLRSGAVGFKTQIRVEDGFEIIESENGAVTRQVVGAKNRYGMSDYVSFPVRGRSSWEFYRDRTTCTKTMSREEMESHCAKLDSRDRPLAVAVNGTYGDIRNLMGPEGISIAMYEDPELVHDMVRVLLDRTKEQAFPLIERLRPEVVVWSEDLCYNHGMLLSPRQFEEFFASYYRELSECAFANGATLLAVDTDGNVMEFIDVAAGCGVNALFPFEVKSNNDLFALRKRHPEFVFFGWLEKEVVNEGNEHLIEGEVLSKAPLLKSGRYFPNGDHAIQPLVTFDGLRKFMTVLHEVCGNPEGEFPRM